MAKLEYILLHTDNERLSYDQYPLPTCICNDKQKIRDN